MTTTHTPGPWHANTRYRQWETGEIVDHAFAAGGICVARITQSEGRSLDECAANARLIAAAPELLAALQRIVDAPRYCCHETTEAMIEGRKAIAKAKGAQS